MKKKSKLRKSVRHYKKRASLSSKLGLILVILALFLGGSIYLALNSGTGPLASFLRPASVNRIIGEDSCGDQVGYHWDEIRGCVRSNTSTPAKSKTPSASKAPSTSKAPLASKAPSPVPSKSPVIASNGGSSCPGGSAGVQIPSGSWAATGHSMGVGRESERECVKCLNGVWQNSATVACHVKYAEDPTKVVLPPQPGNEYTTGTRTLPSSGDTNYDTTYKENCYDSSGVISTTGTQRGTDRCFNGQWLPDSTPNSAFDKAMAATCGDKVYNPATKKCEPKVTTLPPKSGDIFDTISDCTKDLPADQTCTRITGGVESGAYKRVAKQVAAAPAVPPVTPPKCGTYYKWDEIANLCVPGIPNPDAFDEVRDRAKADCIKVTTKQYDMETGFCIPKTQPLTPTRTIVPPVTPVKCGNGYIFRDGYCDNLYGGDRSESMHEIDRKKCEIRNLHYDTSTGLCQAQTSGRPFACDRGQSGTTYVECNPAVPGQGGASAAYHFCSAKPNGNPQEYVVGVGCVDVVGTAVNSTGIFTGGETTKKVEECKYGGKATGSEFTCYYSNGTSTKPVVAKPATLPTSPESGSLPVVSETPGLKKSGSLCGGINLDNVCESGECSLINDKTNGSHWFCMAPSTHDKPTGVTSDTNSTGGKYNSVICKVDSECASKYCAQYTFGSSRCADNPFISSPITSTPSTSTTIATTVPSLTVSPFAMTEVAYIGNSSSAPVNPEASLPKTTKAEYDKLIGKFCVSADTKVYLIDNQRCGIKCEGIPPKTVENCYEILPTVANEGYCKNGNVVDKSGKITSTCSSGCQDGICIKNLQNTGCSSIGEVKPAGNNSYLYCDGTTKQWKPFADSRQFVFTDFCPNSYRTAYLKDAVPIQSSLADYSNKPLYLDCGGTGSQGGATGPDNVTLFCDPIKYANDPGACPSTVIHELMHAWAYDQSNGSSAAVAGFNEAIGCKDLGNGQFEYSKEIIVDDNQQSTWIGYKDGKGYSKIDCQEAFALGNNHYVNNSCYEKANYPIQYQWLKDNIYKGVEFCKDTNQQATNQQVDNTPTVPKIDYVSQLNYSGESVPGGGTWADAGCGVMTGAMVFSLETGVANPYAYNALLNQRGGVTSAGTGWFDQNKPILEENGFDVVPVYGSIDEKRVQITEYAKEGIPVWIVAYVDNGSGHYIGHNTLAVGVDPTTGDLILDDPYYGENYHMPIERFDMDCSKSGTKERDGTYQCNNGTGSWIMNAIIPPEN